MFINESVADYSNAMFLSGSPSRGHHHHRSSGYRSVIKHGVYTTLIHTDTYKTNLFLHGVTFLSSALFRYNCCSQCVTALQFYFSICIRCNSWLLVDIDKIWLQFFFLTRCCRFFEPPCYRNLWVGYYP